MSRDPHGSPERLLGESDAIQEVRELIALAAECDLPVFVHGETGTGKELVAHALHAASRRTGAFVPVNTCAASDAMFEDLLFGHVRGAFTGAVSDRDGCLLEANGGTVLLDEIGSLALDAQVKLLRAVETKSFRPVGSSRERHSDFRIISASNEDIDLAIKNGRFRADLSYRLRGIDIVIPPLRERREDIPLLATHFASRHRAPGGRAARLSLEALDRLQELDWPGNVRELRALVDRAVLFARGAEVVSEAALRRATMLVTPSSGTRPVFVAALNAVGRRDLADVLERHGWDTVAAASELGVTRKTIYARLQRLGVDLPSRGRQRPQ